MIKIIIVDDEKATREGLLTYVPWKELDVDFIFEAENGKKALELALEIKPNIVLTDIRMPQMDGIELANNIREKLPECKIIFLSSYTDKEYLKSAINLQAVSYIEKPVDIDEVKEVFKKTVAQCKVDDEKKLLELNLKNIVTENISFIREKLTIELINVQLDSNIISNKITYLNNCDIYNDNFVSVIINIKLNEPNSSINIHTLKSNLIQSAEQILKENSMNCICGFKDDNFLIIHVYDRNLISNFILNKTFNKFMQTIKDTYENDLKIFIGIGKSKKGIRNIPYSYQTSVLALQNQFFLGYNKVVIYQEKNDKPFIFNDNFFKEFSELVIKENKNEAISLIKKATGDLRLCDNTLVNNVKDFFFKIVLSLSDVSESMGIQIVEHYNREDFLWDIISKIDTLNEIEDYIIDKMKLFFKKKLEKEKSGSSVFNIVKYIQNNFQDENLSIKTISEYEYLTPNYLCLIFKKETGKTINQFITEIRIDKAKEHLRDKKMKLYEIASFVGFSDANYFAKTFKKVVGINPSEYREKFLS